MPHPKLLLLALSFYTRLPHPQGLDYQQLPQAAVYLPLIGWIVGAISACVFYLADFFWSQSTSVILALMIGILATGALHEDGLADVCDGFGGGFNQQRILEIMKDSHIGVYGVLGILLMLLLKFSLLASMPLDIVPFALLCGHSISRLSPLILMKVYTYIREYNCKASGAIYTPEYLELSFAGIIALLPLTLLPWLCTLAIFPVLLATKCLGHYIHHRLGGYTGDCLGASQQIAEITFYLSLSALWTFI